MQVALHMDVFGSGAVFAGGRERGGPVPNPIKSDLGKRGLRNEHQTRQAWLLSLPSPEALQ